MSKNSNAKNRHASQTTDIFSVRFIIMGNYLLSGKNGNEIENDEWWANKEANLRELIAQKDARIAELEKQLTTEEKSIPIATTSLVSKALISDYVDEIVANENINIKGLPDVVEKAIYKNVLLLIMVILEKTSKNSQIGLFGHKVHITIDH